MSSHSSRHPQEVILPGLGCIFLKGALGIFYVETEGYISMYLLNLRGVIEALFLGGGA